MRCLIGTMLLGLSLGATACGSDRATDPLPPGGPPGEPPTPPYEPPTCTISIAAVSAPENFPVLGFGCVAERYTSELWVHGQWAYTGTWGLRTEPGNVLKIWDVSGNTPVLRDSVLVSNVTTPGAVHVADEDEGHAATLGDVQVSDDGTVLIVPTEPSPHGALLVYGLEDPAKPRELARFSNSETAPGIHTATLARVDGKLYGFLCVDPDSAGLARLMIVDLSDATRPREVFSRAMGDPYVHDVFVRDGLLFTALWNAGTTIWDIGGGGRGGSPESPVAIASFPTVGGKVHNIWWYHDPVTRTKRYVFIGEEGPGSIGVSSVGDFHVVDIADLSAPREVAFYTRSGAGAHNFSVDEGSGILYVAYYNDGVRALDVRGDLGSCSAEQKDTLDRCDLGKMGREVGRGLAGYGTTYIWGVHWVGDHLYASDMLNGIWKVDVSSLRR